VGGTVRQQRAPGLGRGALGRSPGLHRGGMGMKPALNPLQLPWALSGSLPADPIYGLPRGGACRWMGPCQGSSKREPLRCPGEHGAARKPELEQGQWRAPWPLA